MHFLYKQLRTRQRFVFLWLAFIVVLIDYRCSKINVPYDTRKNKMKLRQNDHSATRGN